MSSAVSPRTGTTPQHSAELSLVDRGANGFVGGSDCVLIGKPVVERYVSITGINNHQLNNILIATVGASAWPNAVPIICIFNEVACMVQH